MKKGVKSKNNLIIRTVFLGVLVIVVLIALYLAFLSPSLQLSPEEDELQEIMKGTILGPVLQPIRRDAVAFQAFCDGDRKITDSQGNEYSRGDIENIMLQLNGATPNMVENIMDEVCGIEDICIGPLGDANGDGRKDISDGIHINNHFTFRTAIRCENLADCNLDGTVTRDDATMIINNQRCERRIEEQPSLQPPSQTPSPTQSATPATTPTQTPTVTITPKASPSTSPTSSASPKPSASL